MANSYEGMNAKMKLAKARLYFLNSKIGKSGKNIVMEFKYFELEDIVPTAIRIFTRVGLLAVDEIGVIDPVSGQQIAKKSIYNADDPEEEPIVFRVPYKEMDQIVSKTGKIVTNPLQAEGSSITYLRRYLWMVALDITEPDNVDDKLGLVPEEEEIIPEKPKVVTPKAPATVQERAEVKEELVSENKMASEAQLNLLKDQCKALLTYDEEKHEPFVNEIAMKTNGFTEIPADACDQLNEHLYQMVREYEG